MTQHMHTALPALSLSREGDPEIPGPGSTTPAPALAPASSEGRNRWGGAAGTACTSPAQASDCPQGARMQCTGNRVELQRLLDGEWHQRRGGRAAPRTTVRHVGRVLLGAACSPRVPNSVLSSQGTSGYVWGRFWLLQRGDVLLALSG